MADEFILDCLELQQKHMEQKLMVEIQKREASHLKIQSQIDGFKSSIPEFKSNFQEQMLGLNQKLDQAIQVAESIQQLIFNLQNKNQKTNLPAQSYPTQTLAKSIFIPNPPNSQPFFHEIQKKNPRPTSSENQQQNTTTPKPNNLELHPIFHEIHEEKTEEHEGSVLIQKPIEITKKEPIRVAVIEHTYLETTQIGESVEVSYPTLVDIQMPKIQKSEEVLDNPEDLVPNLIGELLEAPKPHEQIFKLGPNSMGLFQEKSMMLRWACFVIDRGRRARSQGYVKKTMVKFGGGLEEAWSRRPPKRIGRRRSYSRRTTKERCWSFLAGVAATTNEKGKGSHRRIGQPFSYENTHHKGGQETAKIHRNSRRCGRFEAWSRRIAPRYDGWRRETELRPICFENKNRNGRSEAWSRRMWKRGGGFRGCGGDVKQGRRRELWSRRLPKKWRPVDWSSRIAKTRRSPTPDFDGSRSSITSGVVDDSGRQILCVGQHHLRTKAGMFWAWADKIEIVYGQKSTHVWVIWWRFNSWHLDWAQSR